MSTELFDQVERSASFGGDDVVVEATPAVSTELLAPGLEKMILLAGLSARGTPDTPDGES